MLSGVWQTRQVCEVTSLCLSPCLHLMNLASETPFSHAPIRQIHENEMQIGVESTLALFWSNQSWRHTLRRVDANTHRVICIQVLPSTWLCAECWHGLVSSPRHCRWLTRHQHKERRGAIKMEKNGKKVSVCLVIRKSPLQNKPTDCE